MKTVAVFDAKNRFSDMIAAVERGQDLTMIRHGLAIATCGEPPNTPALPQVWTSPRPSVKPL